MTVRRRAAIAAAAGVVAVTSGWPASPAEAHGAPSSPVSRAFACRADGPGAARPACRAALAANAGPFGSWDNLRVPDVGGRDRDVIPDGHLCSAGLRGFRGFDLARSDWPSTTLVAGSALTVTYTSTIAHHGAFKVFATKQGYDGRSPLRWSDLDAQPFITAVDPPLSGTAYTFGGTLPANRTGRHVLYTVWQNTDTPDTYYSCSDVVLKAGGAAGAAPVTSASPSRASQAEPRTGSGDNRTKPVPSVTPSASPAPAGEVPPPPPADGAEPVGQHESWLGRAEPFIGERVGLGQQIMTAALIVIAGTASGFAYLRMRARRAQRLHRKSEKR